MFVFVFLAIGVFFVSNVSAFDFRSVSEGVVQNYIDIFAPILSALLGGGDWTGFLLFEKLLLTVLLVTIIYVTLGKAGFLGSQKGVLWLISIVVSLLAIRYMNLEWVNSILFHYGILGVVMTSILPFVIYFFFLHTVVGDHPSIRKVGWILYIMIYIVMIASNSINSYVDTGASPEFYSANLFEWAYILTILAALILLFFDNTFHKYYENSEINKLARYQKSDHIAALMKQIQDIDKDVREGRRSPAIGNQMIKEKQDRIKWIQKNM